MRIENLRIFGKAILPLGPYRYFAHEGHPRRARSELATEVLFTSIALGWLLLLTEGLKMPLPVATETMLGIYIIAKAVNAASIVGQVTQIKRG